MDLTQQKLRSLLEYDPITGLFSWVSGKKAGRVAGFGHRRKRLQICIDGANYYAHRLAWLYTYGENPGGVVDHINGDSLDNRVENLRVLTQRANTENRRGPQSNSGTRFLGVSAKRGRFRAAIKVVGKSIHIGTFDTPEMAHAAYLEHKRRLHEGCTI